MGMRKCTKCGEIKPLDEYNRHESYKDGHRRQCKRCDQLYRENKGTAKMPKKYEINDQTLRNHMYLHFGFNESFNASLSHNSLGKQMRKYYRTEWSPELDRKKRK
jgi:hypothetical protein